MRKIILIICLIASSTFVYSQRPPGGGPETMLAREKQNVLEKVENLSEDQTMLISGIYDEFTVTLKEAFKEARESGSREGMREKMQALRAEKDALIKDVLNESQFVTYQTLTARKRERKGPPADRQ